MREVRQSIGGLGNIMFKQAYIIGEMLDGKIPDVYVQGEKYWKRHADVIRQYFSENIGRDERVAIHIRRGDYLNADHFHVDLSTTDYYKKAIWLFPNKKFLVFCKDNQGTDTEDREWCTNHLNSIIPNQWEFALMTNTETEDMNAMAACDGLIMANSSFSWWAAYIRPEKKIVCPAKWFVDGIQRTELLPEWIKL